MLAVSPHQDDRVALRHILDHSNWRMREARSCREAVRLLEEDPVPVVVCSLEMADGSWRTLLDRAGRLPNPPVLIVFTHDPNERLWAEVLNLGGYDLLTTPFVPQEVFRVAFLAWHAWRHAGAELKTASAGGN